MNILEVLLLTRKLEDEIYVLLFFLKLAMEYGYTEEAVYLSSEIEARFEMLELIEGSLF